MSLTTFLNLREVRQKFKQEFPKPSFYIEKKILAKPLTTNYVLIGTAFDYLLRFYIQRLNRSKTNHNEWVASSVASDYIFKKTQNSFYDEIDPNLGKTDKRDLKDLKSLILAVESRIFKAKVCVLNPTFRMASQMVGGGDADLIIDNTLIDIKTTKFIELTREQYNQIIGYYCLYRLGGVDSLNRRHKITSLGIYYSRFGHLATFTVKDIEMNKNFGSFLKWFERTAKKTYRRLYKNDFLNR